MIYFTSDLHFGHDKPFLYEPRGFTNVYDMNNAIFRNWNRIVTEDDDVYVLGDLMLNNNEGGLWFIKRLRGRIHIILGNHDTDTRELLYRECYNVVEIVYATIVKYGKYRFYLSHYPTLCMHGDDRPPKKDLVNLFGHTHQQHCFFRDEKTGVENYRMYNVGVDAHACTPVSIEDVIADLETAYETHKFSR